MNYKMSDVIVSSVSLTGNAKGGEPLPKEEVHFAYGKIEWTYTEIGHDGKKKGDVKTGWSVTQGTKV